MQHEYVYLIVRIIFFLIGCVNLYGIIVIITITLSNVALSTTVLSMENILPIKGEDYVTDFQSFVTVGGNIFIDFFWLYR